MSLHNFGNTRGRAQQSFIKRCKEGLQKIHEEFSEGGDVGDAERIWREQEGKDRKAELERAQLIPAYMKAITNFSFLIEYCPSVGILQREILYNVPESAMWIDESASVKAAGGGPGAGVQGGEFLGYA